MLHSDLSWSRRKVRPPYQEKITRKLVEKNGGRSLSPLHYNIHDKLADVIHVMDSLLFKPILFIKQFLWNRLSTVVYQSVQSLSCGSNPSVSQGRRFSSELSCVTRQQFCELKACSSRKTGAGSYRSVGSHGSDRSSACGWPLFVLRHDFVDRRGPSSTSCKECVDVNQKLLQISPSSGAVLFPTESDAKKVEVF